MSENPDHPSNYEHELSPEQQKTLQNWITTNFKKSDLYWTVTSYSLKHYFEKSERGFYITNGAFKGAMLAAGFNARHRDEQNWMFNIDRNDELVNADLGYVAETKAGEMIE